MTGQVDRLINKVICFLANVLEAYTVAYFDYDPASGLLECFASHSLSKHFNKDGSLPLDKCGLLYQAFNLNRPVQCGKLEKNISSLIPFYCEKEALIKALCIIPVGNGAGLLYVDTKHKWDFNRKDLLLMQENGDILIEVMKTAEKTVLCDNYKELLRFFYDCNTLINNSNLMDPKLLNRLLEQMVTFVGASYGFLVTRYPSESFTQLRASAGLSTFTLPGSKAKLKNGLIDYTFQRKRTTMISKLGSKGSFDHHLFYYGEPLPRKGSFLSFYGTTCKSEWVLAFLSDVQVFWDSDRVYAINQVFNDFLRSLDRLKLQHECEHLLRYDCFTGLLQSRAFEECVHTYFRRSVSNNRNLTLCLLQWEPYLKICTLLTPSSIAQWNYTIVQALQKDLLGEEVIIGQIGENRLGILLENVNSFDLKKCEFFLGKLNLGKELGCSIRFYSGVSRYPQEASNVVELWNKAYTSLSANLEDKHSSFMVSYEENDIDVLVRRDRAIRA